MTSPTTQPVQATSTTTVTVTQTASSTLVLTTSSTSIIQVLQTSITTSFVSTTTVTSNVPQITVAPRGDKALQNRAVTQTNTAVPPYASPCSGTVRYSSACSCFGVTATTTTLKASTTTTTVTVTQRPTQTTTTATQTLTTSQTATVTKTVTTTSTIEVDVTSTSLSISTDTETATATVTQSCPTQVITNGGFEAGTTDPFTFQNTPNFFDNPGGDLQLVNDPTLAHTGNYLAQVVETDQSLGGLSFTLSQKVQVCPGASYRLNFFTSSLNNVAGATQCNLNACVGGFCAPFDPGQGAKADQPQGLVFPGSTANSVDVTIYSPEIFPGTGITFCGRQYVRFDDFSLTFVA